MGGFAWVTLATNDAYSLGALVLAHSLRRAGTPHDLVALVTPGVSAAMRGQLSSVFSVVQEVNVLDSRDEANLALLERPDLGITFTKLHCWRLTQYEKCVFLDADTLVLKNCDELFEREELSAAPDPGWPDCFNSGVFVYRPSVDTFNALIKFALAKGSFDGGDQGLLNMFFSDWATKDISRHLPFIYNMVATATYSYLPAYKQYGENAKIVHFIGAVKPWLQYFDSETRLVQPPHGSEHMRNLLQLWWDIFCSTVHPSLSPDMLGLAGALSQLTLGAPRSAEQTAFEEHMRKQAWEQGSMDYMGRDSFENIWRKIEETLAQAPPLAQSPPPAQTTPPAQAPPLAQATSEPEPQKEEATEVPPTKSSLEPKIPEPKIPETQTTTLPPSGAGDAPEVPSSTAEPTAPALQSSQRTELSSDSALPKTTEPSAPHPPAPLGGPTPPPSPGDQDKVAHPVPHTPLVTEATPPTSPPIVIPEVPKTDIQALKVDAPSLETPPVGSTPSDLASVTPVTSTVSEDVTQAIADTAAKSVATQESSSPVAEVGAIAQKDIPEQSIPSTPPVVQQTSPAPPASQQSAPPSPATQQTPITPPIPLQAPSTPPIPLQAPSTPPIPLQAPPTPPAAQPAPPTPPAAQPAPPTPPAAQPTPPAAQPAPPTPTAAQPATPTPPAAQPAPPTPPVAQPAPPTPPAAQPAPPTPPAAQPTPTPPTDQPTPLTPSAPEPAPPTPLVPEQAPPTPPAAQPAPPTPPATQPAPPTPPVAQPAPPTPPAAQQESPVPPVAQQVPPAPPTTQQAPPAPPLAQKTPPVPPAAQQAPTTPEAQEISSAIKEVKPTDVLPTPPQSPQIKSLPPTEQVSAVPSTPAETKPAVSSTPSKQASEPTPPPTPSPKAPETKSAEQKDASVPSTQSKTEEPPKAAPSKPSAPAPPPSDAPPSDQAPVPPKRKGHKGAGASTTDQGGASKPAAQPQPSKGSKPGQKGKK